MIQHWLAYTYNTDAEEYMGDESEDTVSRENVEL